MAIPTNDSSGGVFNEINITPLTDIFLVLLIIFMVSAAVTIESAAHIAVPRTKAAVDSKQVDSVLVTLTGDRRLYINQKEVSLRDLQSTLSRTLAQTSQKLVVFKGDPKVILGDMVIILDIAKRAGAQQLGVAVAEASGSDSSTVVVPQSNP